MSLLTDFREKDVIGSSERYSNAAELFSVCLV